MNKKNEKNNSIQIIKEKEKENLKIIRDKSLEMDKILEAKIALLEKSRVKIYLTSYPEIYLRHGNLHLQVFMLDKLLNIPAESRPKLNIKQLNSYIMKIIKAEKACKKIDDFLASLEKDAKLIQSNQKLKNNDNIINISVDPQLQRSIKKSFIQKHPIASIILGSLCLAATGPVVAAGIFFSGISLLSLTAPLAFGCFALAALSFMTGLLLIKKSFQALANNKQFEKNDKKPIENSDNKPFLVNSATLAPILSEQYSEKLSHSIDANESAEINAKDTTETTEQEKKTKAINNEIMDIYSALSKISLKNQEERKNYSKVKEIMKFLQPFACKGTESGSDVTEEQINSLPQKLKEIEEFIAFFKESTQQGSLTQSQYLTPFAYSGRPPVIINVHLEDRIKPNECIPA